jgi:sugar O-acyltransferase (sialic acid O-acetyltransferase NeuD family)
MKKLYIFGEGGLGREVYADFSKNKKYLKKYSIEGFVVDHYDFNNLNTRHINQISKDSSLLIAIGDPHKRKEVFKKLVAIGFTDFPNYISSSVEIDSSIQIGIGNIILKGSVFSVDIKISDFNVINKLCSIGHDVLITNFCTFSPNVSISGNCRISNLCFFGISSTVLSNVFINNKTIIGAGTVVLKDTLANSTYVGVPAKKIV